MPSDSPDNAAGTAFLCEVSAEGAGGFALDGVVEHVVVVEHPFSPTILMVPAYHPCMAYIPDDVSQIPDNHPGYVPASDDERERLTILLHKRLDQIIDQEQQAGISRQDRERLATIHKQIRADLATILYGATERTVREIERRYRASR